MRILLEPERLKRLLSNTLLHTSGDKFLLKGVMGNFSEKGLLIKDSSLEIVAIQALYTKKFFLEFGVEGEENVPIPSSLFEPLKIGFKEEKMEFFNDKSKLFFKTKLEDYDEPIPEQEQGTMPFKMLMTELGIIPEKLNPENPQVEGKGPMIQIQLKAEELSGLPPADEYKFVCKDKKLSVTVPVKELGKYTKVFKPTKIEAIEDMEVSFDGSYFGAIANNIAGEVWVSIIEDAMVVSQKTKDCCITYLLSSQSEEEA